MKNQISRRQLRYIVCVVGLCETKKKQKAKNTHILKHLCRILHRSQTVNFNWYSWDFIYRVINHRSNLTDLHIRLPYDFAVGLFFFFFVFGWYYFGGMYDETYVCVCVCIEARNFPAFFLLHLIKI